MKPQRWVFVHEVIFGDPNDEKSKMCRSTKYELRYAAIEGDWQEIKRMVEKEVRAEIEAEAKALGLSMFTITSDKQEWVQQEIWDARNARLAARAREREAASANNE